MLTLTDAVTKLVAESLRPRHDLEGVGGQCGRISFCLPVGALRVQVHEPVCALRVGPQPDAHLWHRLDHAAATGAHRAQIVDEIDGNGRGWRLAQYARAVAFDIGVAVELERVRVDSVGPTGGQDRIGRPTANSRIGDACPLAVNVVAEAVTRGQAIAPAWTSTVPRHTHTQEHVDLKATNWTELAECGASAEHEQLVTSRAVEDCALDAPAQLVGEIAGSGVWILVGIVVLVLVLVLVLIRVSVWVLVFVVHERILHTRIAFGRELGVECARAVGSGKGAK